MRTLSAACALFATITSSAPAPALDIKSRSEDHSTDFVVRPQGLCHMVTNPGSKDRLVPMKNATDWLAFQLAAKDGTVTTQCCDTSSVNFCDQVVNLPVTKSGQSQSASVLPTIDPAQCYKAYCQNMIGQWRWVSGFGSATADGAFIYAQGVSNPWNTWLLSFKRNTVTPSYVSVNFQCNGHNWQAPAESTCSQTLPASAYYLEWGFNCWAENLSGTGGYYNSHCPGSAPQAPWNPTATYGAHYGGSGAPLQQCVNFQTC